MLDSNKIPHTVLIKIVNYIDDNLDKLCFSFVCKRLFQEKDKYLTFDNKDLRKSIQVNNIYQPQSYKKVLEISINKRNKCTLYLGCDEPHITDEYDYYLDTTKNDIKSYIIPRDVKEIYLSASFGHQIESLNDLSSSNVDTLHIWCDISIKPGEIPTSIKNIIFSGSSNPEKVKGSLPLSIESLIFRGTSVDYIKPMEVLSQLKSLELDSVVPLDSLQFFLRPTLEYLNIVPINEPISDDFLPKSLKTLIGASKLWSKQISSLTSLTELSIQESGMNLISFQFNQLPVSLTNLTLGDSFFIGYPDEEVCIIPYHIKKLTITRYKGHTLEIPPETQVYVTLSYGTTSLPKGGCIEYVNFRYTAYFSIIPNFLPNTVKEVIVGDNILLPNSIPPSVEKLSLSLGSKVYDTLVDIIPPTVNTVITDRIFMLRNPSINLIPKYINTIEISDSHTRLRRLDDGFLFVQNFYHLFTHLYGGVIFNLNKYNLRFGF